MAVITIIIVVLLFVFFFAALVIEDHYVKEGNARRTRNKQIREFERQEHYENHNSQTAPGILKR